MDKLEKLLLQYNDLFTTEMPKQLVKKKINEQDKILLKEIFRKKGIQSQIIIPKDGRKKVIALAIINEKPHPITKVIDPTTVRLLKPFNLRLKQFKKRFILDTGYMLFKHPNRDGYLMDDLIQGRDIFVPDHVFDGVIKHITKFVIS